MDDFMLDVVRGEGYERYRRDKISAKELEQAVVDHPFDRELKCRLFSAYIREGLPLDATPVEKLLHPFEDLMLTDLREATRGGPGKSLESLVNKLIHNLEFVLEVRLETENFGSDSNQDSPPEDEEFATLCSKAEKAVSSVSFYGKPIFYFELPSLAIIRAMSRRTKVGIELFRWGHLASFKPLPSVYSEITLLRSKKGYELVTLNACVREYQEEESEGKALLSLEDIADINSGTLAADYWLRDRFTIL